MILVGDDKRLNQTGYISGVSGCIWNVHNPNNKTGILFQVNLQFLGVYFSPIEIAQRYYFFSFKIFFIISCLVFNHSVSKNYKFLLVALSLFFLQEMHYLSTLTVLMQLSMAMSKC